MYKFLYAHVEQLFCPLDLLFCHILVSIANLVWLRSPKASLNMDLHGSKCFHCVAYLELLDQRYQ